MRISISIAVFLLSVPPSAFAAEAVPTSKSPSTSTSANPLVKDVHCRAVANGKVGFDARVDSDDKLLAIDKSGEVFAFPSPALHGPNLMNPADRALTKRAERPGTLNVVINVSDGRVRLNVYQRDKMSTEGAGSATLKANGTELTCSLP